MKIVKYVGERFGSLTVVDKLASHVQPGGQKRAMLLAVCDCGVTVRVRAADLRSGNTKTCGGFVHRSATQTRHGKTRSAAHSVWCGMRRRCDWKRGPQYADYGGRGITVCDRWQSFENFHADMGDPPRGMQIDRIDNDGPYSPDNCRWATAAEQARNRRSNINITINGETKCLMDWAKQYGHPPDRVTARMRLLGWTVMQALTTPIRGRPSSIPHSDTSTAQQLI